MEWIILGFLLVHLLLVFGILAALIQTLSTQGRRSKSSSDREGRTAHSMR